MQLRIWKGHLTKCFTRWNAPKTAWLQFRSCRQKDLLCFIRLKHCLIVLVYLQGRHVIRDIKGLWFEYRSKYRLSPQHCRRRCDQINIYKSVTNPQCQWTNVQDKVAGIKQPIYFFIVFQFLKKQIWVQIVTQNYRELKSVPASLYTDTLCQHQVPTSPWLLALYVIMRHYKYGKQ